MKLSYQQAKKNCPVLSSLVLLLPLQLPAVESMHSLSGRFALKLEHDMN